jgi:hypothetical protein
MRGVKRRHEISDQEIHLLLKKMFVRDVPDTPILPRIEREWLMVWFVKELLKPEQPSKEFFLLASAIADTLEVTGLMKSNQLSVKIAKTSKATKKKNFGSSWNDVIDGDAVCGVEAAELVELMAVSLADRTGLSVLQCIQENYKLKHRNSLNFD